LEAAEAHAAEAGATDHAVGDLQFILRATWRLLTPAQRRALFAEPGLQELSGLPEYEQLIGHLTRRDGDLAGEGGLWVIPISTEDALTGHGASPPGSSCGLMIGDGLLGGHRRAGCSRISTRRSIKSPTNM
jgi:hypothetical protein